MTSEKPTVQHDQVQDGPEALFKWMAVRSGAFDLFDPDGRLPPTIIALCYCVVEACALIGDDFTDTQGGSNAGEQIRGMLGEPKA